MNIKEIGVESMVLLPPKPGACPECAAMHTPEFPHNRDSLYYQMKFRQKHGRFPTWNDAMAHCSAEMKAVWKNELANHGVNVEETAEDGE